MGTGNRGTKRVGAVLAPLFAVAVLAGCGGDGSISLPTVSVSVPTALPSISVSLPSITLPSIPEATPSESPEEPPETPTEEPSDTPTEEPTTAEPTPTPTPTSTRTAVVTRTVTPTEPATPTSEPSATPSPTVSALAPTTDDAAESGIPSWVWWLLAAAALAAVVAAILVPRSRRRAAWTADLAAAEAEAGWFARELLPQLQLATTADALAGGWQVAAGRVTALEDRLTGLESSAPDEALGAGARQLRDAVRAARSGVEGLIASRDMTSSSARLGSVAAGLEASLRPPAH